MNINLVLHYKVVYSWHNFRILVIILFFNSIKLIAMNCITWEFNSYTRAKQGRELHYSVMSSDKLAWRGTIKTVGMNVACITLTCHQHIGSRRSQCILSIRCLSKFGTVKTDKGQISQAEHTRPHSLIENREKHMCSIISSQDFLSVWLMYSVSLEKDE